MKGDDLVRELFKDDLVLIIRSSVSETIWFLQSSTVSGLMVTLALNDKKFIASVSSQRIVTPPEIYSQVEDKMEKLTDQIGWVREFDLYCPDSLGSLRTYICKCLELT